MGMLGDVAVFLIRNIGGDEARRGGALDAVPAPQSGG